MATFEWKLWSSKVFDQNHLTVQCFPADDPDIPRSGQNNSSIVRSGRHSCFSDVNTFSRQGHLSQAFLLYLGVNNLGVNLAINLAINSHHHTLVTKDISPFIYHYRTIIHAKRE